MNERLLSGWDLYSKRRPQQLKKWLTSRVSLCCDDRRTPRKKASNISRRVSRDCSFRLAESHYGPGVVLVSLPARPFTINHDALNTYSTRIVPNIWNHKLSSPKRGDAHLRIWISVTRDPGYLHVKILYNTRYSNLECLESPIMCHRHLPTYYTYSTHLRRNNKYERIWGRGFSHLLCPLGILWK